jgi:hypothetical protein
VDFQNASKDANANDIANFGAVPTSPYRALKHGETELWGQPVRDNPAEAWEQALTWSLRACATELVAMLG